MQRSIDFGAGWELGLRHVLVFNPCALQINATVWRAAYFRAPIIEQIFYLSIVILEDFVHSVHSFSEFSQEDQVG